MNDNNTDRPTAVIVREYPDGSRLVTVPDANGQPAPRGVLAIVDTDEQIREIMLRIPREFVRDMAAEQATVSMIDREPTPAELDSILRALATSLHDVHDRLLASVAAELVDRIGGSQSPRDAVLLSMRQQLVDRIADSRDPEPEDRDRIEQAMQRVQQDIDRGGISNDEILDTMRSIGDSLAGVERDPIRYAMRRWRADLIEEGNDPETVRESVERLRLAVESSGIGDRIRDAARSEPRDNAALGEAMDALADLAIKTAREDGLVPAEDADR